MYQPVSHQTKSNQSFILRKLHGNDFDQLNEYLDHLSQETKKRFGPHPFDKDSIVDFYSRPNDNTGFVAEDIANTDIIAYSIIKRGYLAHDKQRLESYGLQLDNIRCCTFAPSVADDWQSVGIGKAMLGYIVAYLRIAGIENIILWGGVQSTNENAVNFYKKAGFKTLGRFEYFGSNYDMMLTINP